MRRYLAMILIVLLSGATSAVGQTVDIGGVKVPADCPMVRGEHPRLLFQKKDLPAIRERLKHPRMQKELAWARSIADKTGPNGSRDECLLGVLWQLTGERKYADLGIDTLMKRKKDKRWFQPYVFAVDLLLDSVQFKSVMGIDPLEIAELRPQARSQAYKYWQYTPGTASGLLPAHQSIYPDLPSDRKALVRSRHVYSAINSLQDPLFFIPIAFGPLQPFDAYFSGLTRDGFIAYHYLNPSAARGYASYSYHPLTGWKFLQNLLHVNTFITNAKYDLVVYTNALPPALAMHTDLVSAVIHQSDRPNASTRPGLIEVRYRSEVLGAGENPVRTIRFPYYTDSSHPVSLTEPAEFFHDVQTWLKER